MDLASSELPRCHHSFLLWIKSLLADFTFDLDVEKFAIGQHHGLLLLDADAVQLGLRGLIQIAYTHGLITVLPGRRWWEVAHLLCSYQLRGAIYGLPLKVTC